MILVDTSVWIDHLRVVDPILAELLEQRNVLGHPFVTGEIALGHLSDRVEVTGLLRNLPQSKAATDVEVLHFIDEHRLFGRGIGYVDAHLLASAALTDGAKLWTRDQRLAATASDLKLVMS